MCADALPVTTGREPEQRTEPGRRASVARLGAKGHQEVIVLALVQVQQSMRRSVRRAVQILCDVESRWWDEPVEYQMTELSSCGAFLTSDFLLEEGSPIRLCFRPLRWAADPIRCRGIVRRAAFDRRGMGVEFCALPEPLHLALADSLRGLPPPLPTPQAGSGPALRAVRPGHHEVVEVSFEDEQAASLQAIALAPVLTGGGLPPRHASCCA